MSADPLEPDCVCGHDHYASMSADREMWTSTCPYCPCENFRAASPVPVGTPAPTLTRCESCHTTLAVHGPPHEWDTLKLPSCPPPSLTGTFRAPPAPDLCSHCGGAGKFVWLRPGNRPTTSPCEHCQPPAPTSETAETPQRQFAARMLRQYDRLVATKQNQITGTLLVVQDYEMEQLRAASPAPAATPPLTYKVIESFPYVWCNECGAKSRSVGLMGQIHDCQWRGAWELVNKIGRASCRERVLASV